MPSCRTGSIPVGKIRSLTFTFELCVFPYTLMDEAHCIFEPVKPGCDRRLLYYEMTCLCLPPPRQLPLPFLPSLSEAHTHTHTTLVTDKVAYARKSTETSHGFSASFFFPSRVELSFLQTSSLVGSLNGIIGSATFPSAEEIFEAAGSGAAGVVADGAALAPILAFCIGNHQRK